MRKTRKKKFTYKSGDFNSGDGMLTTVWGPSMWHYLHIMSFNYPVNPTGEDKKNYKDFILSLRHNLPCKHCRENLKRNFKAHPLEQCHMKNRDSFSRYIYRLHEIINKMLGKKSGLSYCEVRERYEHFRARCNKSIKITDLKLKKENGCTEPLYGVKSKCVIQIVPQETKCKTFNVNSKCKTKRVTQKIKKGKY